MKRFMKLWVASVLIAAAAIISGCGGDDDSEGAKKRKTVRISLPPKPTGSFTVVTRTKG